MTTPTDSGSRVRTSRPTTAPSTVTQLLDLGAAVDLEVPVAAATSSSSSRSRASSHGDVGGVPDVEPVDRVEAAVRRSDLDLALLHLEEPHGHGDDRVAAVDEHLDLVCTSARWDRARRRRAASAPPTASAPGSSEEQAR